MPGLRGCRLKPPRQRVDQLMVDRGLAPTKAKAQALLLAGRVFSGQRRLDKPGTAVADDVALTVRDDGPGWVSRGALKLIHGLDHFAIDPAGLTAIDVGASTGGFTEVLLARGASRVFAVDVGYGQLAPKLRDDPRVTVLERTNARYLTSHDIPSPVDLVVCDASFIGLATVLPAALSLTSPGVWLVALIKPQFEVGRGKVGKGGVVREPVLREEVVTGVTGWLSSLPGWKVNGVVESPIAGPAGNVEYLIGARRSG